MGRGPGHLEPQSPGGSRLELYQEQFHSDNMDDVMLTRDWFEVDGGFRDGDRWRSCCRDLCQRLRGGGGMTDLSALERRKKAQEWTNVFRCRIPPQKGGAVLACAYRSARA